MTDLNPNHKITHEKLDLTREDIRKLMPILTLLDTEEQEKDLDFADRLFNLLQSLIEKGDRQERLLAQLNRQLTEMMAYLKILTDVATQDEESGFSD
ncbi:hypothetical protein [Roseobacter sp. GAI101]|uniref:hypothetical protein n=1 Tax=Roseobacter sp. (strain GAI101) TaxID=391589 RepID=UPI00055D5F76|nr:hypothetical protein [Roseobacter sp. GAI101]